jgi:branched-chain amino acid transport system permease protein
VEQFIVSGLATGAIYALVAVGFVVIHNVTGIINFAQGEFAMAGAFAAVIFYEHGLPLPLACLLAAAVAALVGLVTWYAALRGAARSSPVLQIIITIGVSIALRGLALFVFGSSPRALPAFSAGEVHLGNAVVAAQEIWILGIVVLLMTLLWLLFEKTRIGAALLAASINRDAARLMGIDPLRMSAIAFALGAALAGIAGFAIAPVTFATYDMGLSLGLKGFVAAVLGGVVSIPGAVIGGLSLGILESLGTAYVPSGWRDAIAFGILLLVLFVRPQGVFGRTTVRV